MSAPERIPASSKVAAQSADGWSQDSLPGFVEWLDLEGAPLGQGELAPANDCWPPLTAGSPEAGLARAALEAAKAGRPSHFLAQWALLGGQPRWWDVTVAPVPGSAGRPERVVVVSRDVTAEREAAAQTDLLIQELGHRVRNAFAMAGAVAMQTLGSAETAEMARTTLGQRLATMARAHEWLVDRCWEQMDIAVVLRLVLTTHELPGQPSRFDLSGPSFALGATAAMPTSLLCHELATNAVRHGALSTAGGRVSIQWSIGGDDEFRLEWLETGGRPVRAPSRRGFGSRLLVENVPRRLGGTAALDFRPEGLRFSLRAPAARLRGGA